MAIVGYLHNQPKNDFGIEAIAPPNNNGQQYNTSLTPDRFSTLSSMGTISDSLDEIEMSKQMIYNRSHHAKFLPSQPPLKKRKLRIVRSSDPWQERYKDLIRFHIRNGHCLVPYTYPENPALARWVKRQRYEYKQLLKQQGQTKQKAGGDKQTSSSMNAERIKMLESIGFVWDSHQATWEKMLEELKDFKKEHGHCEVPSKYPDNLALATWVSRQRAQYKLYCNNESNGMPENRVAALNKVGFKWGVRCREEKAEK